MAVNGIIGRKIGMAQMFDDQGNLSAVTAIEAGPCYVCQVKTESRDGYNAVQLGFGEARRLNSPEKGHLRGAGRDLKYLREFRVNEPDLEMGQKIDVSIFQPGDRVDVTGTSKGRGFAGGVKRHHFGGGPKTHGQSDRHRAPGSIGGTTYPGRVFKGTRMAGHMGDRRVTVRGLEVVQADAARNLLVLKGAVPGAVNGLLLIRRSGRRGS
ncbi:MAG: 50S ribosomal protein L3 [Chloroflexi bacterium]|nr:MAG: 50S ribosomal protein L3 [Chloroflexota bacterium]RLC95901.1 MAG: 50S ribosomal protein L3 [Chloroflexota bacterium]